MLTYPCQNTATTTTTTSTLTTMLQAIIYIYSLEKFVCYFLLFSLQNFFLKMDSNKKENYFVSERRQF